MSKFYTLRNLGWQAFFQQQLSLEEWENLIPARILERHKSLITLASERGIHQQPILPSFPALTVGDWVLLDRDEKYVRILERKTCFSRKAAGTKVAEQLISANVDSAFIISSMNEDFNLSRIERYLSLANDAGAETVLLLSKSDLSQNTEYFILEAQSLDALLPVFSINCLDKDDTEKLSPWIKEGKTIAVLGSSGVGKSTLVNTLLGNLNQTTGDVREDDNKGRHTTTRRSLFFIESGGLVLDTPGMRELQLSNCKEGISSTFHDIESLSQHCKFKNCSHQNEPGCAVQGAIENGQLDKRRLSNYLKLVREDALNSATLAERRSKDKALGKFYKRTMVDSLKLKGKEK